MTGPIWAVSPEEEPQPEFEDMDFEILGDEKVEPDWEDF